MVTLVATTYAIIFAHRLKRARDDAKELSLKNKNMKMERNERASSK